MEAVEIVIDADMNSFYVSEWQKELGKEEAKKITANSTLLIDWEQAKSELKL